MIDGGSDVPVAIANWIVVGGHTRPFWRDPDFIADFGRVARTELRAAVDELKRRAEAKARAAGMPNGWAANFPNHHAMKGISNADEPRLGRRT